jgi:uncharacterized protein
MYWLIVIAVLLVVDLYVYQAVVTVSRNWAHVWKVVVRYGFWIPTILALSAILYYVLGDPYKLSHTTRSLILTGIFAVYISKLFGVVVLVIDDLQRAVRWVMTFFEKYKGDETQLAGEAISRSEFLSKTALAVAAVPFAAMTYGIVSGAHDYRVRRKTIILPNLPKAFDGIRIGQLSDIHSGSFFNRVAVAGGVEMMLREKPDVVFFTGDLVNNEASEVVEYIDIFGKLKAPLGVFSVTGNHDYGDYKKWQSRGQQLRNFRDLVEAHRLMGFDLLMNEHRFIEAGGESVAVLGIENWGAGGFSKYGKLADAYRGTEHSPVKLLLSHDPSHWDAQVRSGFSDIDITFAGHTHGFQFGVEIGGFKWSPSQYVYKQWAGLYQEGTQYLYVNRGFGYLGYPGRVGMPPELTIVELKRG